MPHAGEGTKSLVCLNSCKASQLNEETLSAVSLAFYPSKK